MKLTPRRLAIALTTAFLCHTALAADPVATVNGKAIPAAYLDTIMKEQRAQGMPDSQQLVDAVREELIRREVLSQAADKANIAKKEEVAAQIALARQAILIRAYLQDYLAKNPVSDVEILAEYEAVKPRLAGTEYLPRHILVESEAEAQKIIDRLRAGEDFAALAKESKDPGSRERGGELGWGPAEQYVPPFAEALVALKKGEFSRTPVQSNFGYHILRLDDLRDVEAPPLDELKEQIREHLEQQRAENHMNDLRTKAKVQ